MYKRGLGGRVDTEVAGGWGRRGCLIPEGAVGEGYFMTYLYVDVIVAVIQQGEQSDFSTVGPRHGTVQINVSL